MKVAMPTSYMVLLAATDVDRIQRSAATEGHMAEFATYLEEKLARDWVKDVCPTTVMLYSDAFADAGVKLKTVFDLTTELQGVVRRLRSPAADDGCLLKFLLALHSRMLAERIRAAV